MLLQILGKVEAYLITGCGLFGEFNFDLKSLALLIFNHPSIGPAKRDERSHVFPLRHAHNFASVVNTPFAVSKLCFSTSENSLKLS